jgi:hypothetical protein
MGILGDIGTLGWAKRTNGILGRGERARFVAAILLEQGRATPRVLAVRAGVGKRRAGPDPSELTPPDSALAREVIDVCAGELAEAVVEHSYRSYLYARALAVVDGIECDEEATFAGAMLHDYGIKDIPQLRDRCFTLPGAERAEELGEGAGWEAERTHAAAEAITLHLNPVVPVEQGAVQHLVHDGVLLDAVGLRAAELDAEGIRHVRERHPRLGFNRVGLDALREHGRSVAGCRTEAVVRTGFGLALRLGPWQD